MPGSRTTAQGSGAWFRAAVIAVAVACSLALACSASTKPTRTGSLDAGSCGVMSSAGGKAGAGGNNSSDASAGGTEGGVPDASVGAGGDGSIGAGGAGGAGLPESGAGGAGTGGAASTLCGNGHLDLGEQCDDGNTLDEDDCSSQCTDSTACENCLLNNVCIDLSTPSTAPPCSDFTDAPSRDACYSVYACAVSTQCFLKGGTTGTGGPWYCYCGDVDAPTCKNGSGTGACKAVIDAAFQEAPGGLPITDSNAILSNLYTATIPAAAAMYTLNCAYVNCGILTQTYECVAGGAPGTGGAGTGGAPGTGGAGSAIPPGTSPCTSGTPSGQDCIACEANNCPHDAVNQPYCQDLSTAAAQAACQAALDCVRQTDCIANGAVACYCGADEGIVGCKDNAAQPGFACPNGICGTSIGAHGACIGAITAAFPDGSSPSTIVNNLSNVATSGGAALTLAECDYVNCGDLTGTNECVPYCK